MSTDAVTAAMAAEPLAAEPLAEPAESTVPLAAVLGHLDEVHPAVETLRREAARLAGWGAELAARLLAGQRLLAAGNGGSAAEAQHLTAELVGRFDGEREPFSAISLHAETSAVTAIANDYGYDQLFARQVLGHGRAGDVLVLLSTSGRSPNLLHAAEAARRIGVTSWALTGPAPNPLTEVCDDYVAVEAPSANVQECHLIALHALCRAFDAEVGLRRPRRGSGRLS
ncbi:D-sedoheptulose-7-phosphate isomerase [Arthrobacter mobilis]|uniref:SIS domain-containing protein n=1 Tax=Arthrobacter mobilis TaxID=2724944 RepID=A0A7X6HCR7_9MICC|nr:SIS domain-containing protein [Arthrobacter mobilis]NKX54135.1 SIS domain-containing protein [Arthrobacter mobilis]